MFPFKKKLILGVCVLLLLNVVVPAEAIDATIGAVISLIPWIHKEIEKNTGHCYVTVENQGRHHAHLWCASKDDRIGGNDGVWVEPGKSLGWTFGKTAATQFWCTLDWYGRRYGWDVYVANWGGKYGEWVIKDDGIYEKGGRKQMDIES
ncbi:unnamed protein product [Caenorhabditis nigoni]